MDDNISLIKQSTENNVTDTKTNDIIATVYKVIM